VCALEIRGKRGGPGLMCPPLRPVAPLHSCRASMMTRVELGECSKRVLAMLVPVIPLPMMTTSAVEGNGER